VRAAEHEIVVKPSTVLEVHFTPSPARISVRRDTIREFDMPQAVARLGAPAEEGVFVLNVNGWWANGQGDWLVQVRVRKSQ
jgi:hypothetical protein